MYYPLPNVSHYASSQQESTLCSKCSQTTKTRTWIINKIKQHVSVCLSVRTKTHLHESKFHCGEST